MCCEENKIKLIPVVILIAALIAGLLIAFVRFLTPLFPFILVVSLVIFVVTGILVAICGLRRNDREHLSLTCMCVHCYAPTVLIFSFISIILSLIAIPILITGPLTILIVSIIFAIIFSVAIVFFLGMFLCMLDEDDCRH